MARRTERWTRDGRTTVFDVANEVIEVDYDLFAWILMELGFSREESEQ